MMRRHAMEIQHSTDKIITWRDKLKCLMKRITVEPFLFIYLFAGGLWWPAFDALQYEKACRLTLNNGTVCSHVEQLRAQREDDVQTKMSHWQFYHTLASDLPPLVVSFLYGAVADYKSRKATILIPTIGIACVMVWFIINSAFMEMNIGWLLLSSLNSFTGGWLSLHVGCFSYLSIISSAKDRTYYFAIAEGMISTGVAMSLFLSGIVLEHSNFITVFSISLTLYITAIVYLTVVIKEPSCLPNRPIIKKKLKCKESLASFTCVFKKRPQNGRQQILILLLCLTTFMLATGGDHLRFLHLKHHPLAWSQTLYGYFRGFTSALRAVAIFAVGVLLKKKPDIHDTHLMMAAFFTKALATLVFGLSTRTWMVFIGQTLAAFSSLHSAMNLVTSAIFNRLYPLTLHTSSAILFCVGSGLTLIPMALVWWLHNNLISQNSFKNLVEDSRIDMTSDINVRENTKNVNMTEPAR